MVCNVLNSNELTDQRRKVLDLHLAGLTPREIANALSLSTQRIYAQLAKLEVRPNTTARKAS